MQRRLALALAAVVSSSAAPPCEWSGALPNAYVGAALGAASFATAAEAMAACTAAANCTGVTSPQGAAPPWGSCGFGGRRDPGLRCVDQVHGNQRHGIGI